MVTPHLFQVTAQTDMGYDSDSDDLNLVADMGFAVSDSDLEEADQIMIQIQQNQMDHLNTPNNSPVTPLHDHLDQQSQLDQLQLQLDRDAALANALSRNLDPLNAHDSPNNSFNLADDQSFVYIDETDASLDNNHSDLSLPSLPEVSWLPAPPSPNSSTTSAPPLYEELDHPPAYSHLDREQFLTTWENRLRDRSAALDERQDALDERSAQLDAEQARLAALETSLLVSIASLASQ